MKFVERDVALTLHREFLQRGTQASVSRHLPWLLITQGMECVGKSDILEQIYDEYTSNGSYADEQLKMMYLDCAKSSLEDYFSILEQIISLLGASCDKQAIASFEEELATSRRQMAAISTRFPRVEQNISAYGSAQMKSVNLSIRIDKILQVMEKGKKSLVDNLTSIFKKTVLTLQERTLVILIDNFECLSERNQEIAYWLVNSLIPDIHEDLIRSGSNKRCLVLMTSRLSPPFDVIKQHQVNVLTLLPWNKRMVITYLQDTCGVYDSDLHELIFAQTFGHVYCIRLFIDLLRVDEGQVDTTNPAPAFANATQLISDFLRVAWQEFVQARILRRLKYPLNDLFRYSVIVEYFNQHKWCTIFEEFLSVEHSRDVFEDFVRYPSIQFESEKRSYAVNPLLRRIILNHITNNEKSEFEKFSQNEAVYLEANNNRI